MADVFDQFENKQTTPESTNVFDQFETPTNETTIGADVREAKARDLGVVGVAQNFLTADPKERQQMLVNNNPTEWEPLERTITQAEKDDTVVPDMFLDDKEYLVRNKATGEVLSMNKPGMSWQDLQDIATQALAFTPAGTAGKLAVKHGVKKLALASGATDVGQQAGVVGLEGKEEIDPWQTALTAGMVPVGAGVASGITKYADSVISNTRTKIDSILSGTPIDPLAKVKRDSGVVGADDLIPTYVREEGDYTPNIDISPIPFTRGQLTGFENNLAQEQYLARKFPEKFQAFQDEFVEPAMKSAYSETQDPFLPTAGVDKSFADYGGQVFKSMEKEKAFEKVEVEGLYDLAKESAKSKNLALKPNAGEMIQSDIKETLSKKDIANIDDGDDIDNILTPLFNKLNQGTRNKQSYDKQFTEFENVRKLLNGKIGEADRAGNGENVNILTAVREELDNIQAGLDERNFINLFKPDVKTEDANEVLNDFKLARETYKEYAQRWKNDDIKKLFKIMTKTQTPEKMLTTILGLADTGSSQMSAQMIKAIKGATVDINPIKMGIMSRIFTGLGKGDTGLNTPKQVRDRYNQIFDGRSETAMKELFGKDYDEVKNAISTMVDRYSREPNAPFKTSWWRNTNLPVIQTITNMIGDTMDERKANEILTKALLDAKNIDYATYVNSRGARLSPSTDTLLRGAGATTAQHSDTDKWTTPTPLGIGR